MGHFLDDVFRFASHLIEDPTNVTSHNTKEKEVQRNACE
jgi:hypothetical protein